MIAEFIRAIHDGGIPIEGEIIGDGRLHRAHVAGDKAGSKNAWYVLHGGDHPAGAFGCNKRGISGKWRPSGKTQPLTHHDRARIDADGKARAEAQERAYSDAAARAKRILHQATLDASQHAYVMRKGIQSHGVKVNCNGLLCIPIFSARTGMLQTLQFIAGDGVKTMLTSGRLKEGCFPFQDGPDFWANAKRNIGIGEGLATCATLAESLPNVAMFAAFSAANLPNVAHALRQRFPDAQIVIFGDNDASGAGQRYAMAAAHAVDGFIAIPPIPERDWNDMRGAA